MPTLKTSEVIFRGDLYPRIKTDPNTVERYQQALDLLPPIEVNQRNELIDGWHRWTAHRASNIEEIEVEVIETRSDAHLLELAIVANAKHGMQLSGEDKMQLARTIFQATKRADQKDKKSELAALLSVSFKTLDRWLSRIEAAQREKDAEVILDMWLACYTEEEIGTTLGLPQQTVHDHISKLTENGQMSKIGTHPYPVEFQVPIYNVWKKQTKTSSNTHPGNSEQAWVDNLVYLYTEPGDIVVDPFAGGGSTIDICKKRGRRYWASDLTPIVAREKEIRQLDITKGMPTLQGRWQDVKLVYLDPPYWLQAAGEYGDSPSNFANMNLATFHTKLHDVISRFLKVAPSAAVALIIQPTQWRAPEKAFTDHVAAMIKTIDAPIVQRIQAPYESQQCMPQMVDWAKETKQLLVLSREIIVWRN